MDTNIIIYQDISTASKGSRERHSRGAASEKCYYNLPFLTCCYSQTSKIFFWNLGADRLINDDSM